MGKPLTPAELAKITPIPYPDNNDDEQEDEGYAKLSHEQLQRIDRANSGHVIDNIVTEAITADKDKPKPPPLAEDDD